MILIKKYSNRRLYDTNASAYVNLQQIAEHIRAGDRIRVVDAKEGEDLTQQVLLQVLLEVQGGHELLPSGLLHRMIRSTHDHPIQRMALRQLSAGLALLDQQMEAFERQLGWMNVDRKQATAGPSPAASPAEPPVPTPSPAPPRAATPPPAPVRDDVTPKPGPSTRPRRAAPDTEMDALRERLAALERRLSED